MKCLNKSKTAQMELLGIALVVVLIIVGLLFFVVRDLNEKPMDLQSTYMRKQFAQNTLDVMIRSKTNCRGLDFVTLIEDCGKDASKLGSIQCGAVFSCQFIKNEMDGILNRTLGQWNIPYVFVAYKDTFKDQPVFAPVESGNSVGNIICTHRAIIDGAVNRETPGIQPIPLYPSVLNLELYICTR